ARPVDPLAQAPPPTEIPPHAAGPERDDLSEAARVGVAGVVEVPAARCLALLNHAEDGRLAAIAHRRRGGAAVLVRGTSGREGRESPLPNWFGIRDRSPLHLSRDRPTARTAAGRVLRGLPVAARDVQASPRPTGEARPLHEKRQSPHGRPPLRRQRALQVLPGAVAAGRNCEKQCPPTRGQREGLVAKDATFERNVTESLLTSFGGSAAGNPAYPHPVSADVGHPEAAIWLQEHIEMDLP
ncbi:MAG: hypothetical protein BJ554DRAFT_5463, partial [Olpidium bornovanus]